MTDAEKAHFAATVFAQKKYRGISLWFVKETLTRRTQYGEPANAIEAYKNSASADETIKITIAGGLSLSEYDAQDAYLIALALEQGHF